VTGGAKGIGRAVSEQLAAAGWDLVLCGRDQGALEAAAVALREAHGRAVEPVALDLSRPEGPGELLARFAEPAELPLALVCGAADYGVLGPLAEVDFAAWKRSFDLNFFSVAELLQRYLQRAGPGPFRPRRRIVVMGGAGLGSAEVSGAVSAYSCAKAALYRLVEVVHAEVHARGLDVNCVLPGLVDTGIVDQALAAGPALGALYQASLAARQGRGTPAAVPAGFIAHLLSDACAGLSGRLLSARWDRPALDRAEALAADPDLFRLRRIDEDLYGKKRR
jgi:NAD(P)-dependent dehydrogenase (short-subunit alcohol dehydrogenase family)